MTRALSVVLAIAMFLVYQPVPIAALVQNTGEIAGTAVVEGKPLVSITVRVRNIDSGQLVGQMVTNEKGEFRFISLPIGNYVVETVAPDGTILGTSTRIALVAGAMIATGVSVSTSGAAAAAAGVKSGGGAGAAGAGAAAAGAGAAAAGAGAAAGATGAAAAGGGFFATTAGIVTLAAVGGGVAVAFVAANTDSSPSQ